MRTGGGYDPGLQRDEAENEASPRRSDGVHPLLIVMSGQVASGKSSVARELADRLGAVCVVGDRVRADLLSHASASVHEVHAWREFAPGLGQHVYDELLRRAEDALRAGRPVVVDACFPHNGQRLVARSLARRLGVPFVLVECRVSEDTVRTRLAARDASSHTRGWQAIHDDLAGRWEPVSGIADDEYLLAESEGAIDDVAGGVLAKPPFRRARRDVARGTPLGTRRMPRPSAVTFDCWNTLLYEDDWPTAHALRVAELQTAAREAGRDVSLEDAQRAFDAAWNRHMRVWAEGVATGAHEVALWGLAALGLHDPHPALEHLVAMFEEASHSGRVRALDGTRATLAALARAGIPCALVCDTGLTPGRVVRRHLDLQGLLEGLAVQIFSDEVGVPKPDPRVFRAALEPLGVTPERALHVGDLRRTDVAGARALGMSTVRIRDRHHDASDLPEADYVVQSHAELEKLLGLEQAPEAEPAAPDPAAEP